MLADVGEKMRVGVVGDVGLDWPSMCGWAWTGRGEMAEGVEVEDVCVDVVRCK